MTRPHSNKARRKSLQRNRGPSATNVRLSRQMFLEPLEDRRMMAVVEVDLTGGALTILGDQDGGDLNDSILISYDGGSDSYTLFAGAGTSITEAPGTAGVPSMGGLKYSGVNSVTFNALTGNDSFSLLNSPDPLDSITFNGASGDDKLDLSLMDTSSLGSLAKNLANFGFNGVATGAASFTSVNSVVGSVAGVGDSIAGTSEASAWTIDETTTSTYVSGGQTLKFSNFEQLNGSTNTDSYTITDLGAVAYTVAGGAGSNTLNLTGVPNADVKLTNLGGISVDGFESTQSLTFQQINKLSGGAGTNKLTGTNNSSTWVINDTTGNSAPNLSFSGFTSLTGGSATDTFLVQDNSSNTYSLAGGDGVDSFQFGLDNSLDKLTNNIAVDGGTGGAHLTLHDQADPSNNNYSLTAATVARVGGGTVTYGNIVDLTINAGSGSNQFAITAVPTATGTKTLNGGTGNDVLDLTALATAKVTLTAANATSGFNGTVDGVANFTAVEDLKGSAAGVADELVGLNATSTWTINDTTGNTYVSTKTAKFSGFEKLSGGSAADTFNVQDNSVSNDYTLSGGAGVDAFNLGLANSLDKLTKNITVSGDADGATLTLNDQADANNNDYTLGANTVGRDGGGTATYSDITTLTLNASNTTNNIKITGTPTAGAVVINGGSGNDVLDLSAAASAKVTLTAANVVSGFNGTVDGGAAFTGVEKFVGSAAGVADEFTGLNAVSTWTINDTTGSTYVSTKTASISGFEKLNGGSAVDTFNVQDNSVSNDFTLNGGGGLDAFNFGLANSLDKITKNISVNGDTASAKLTLNDQGDADLNDYTIGTNTIGRDGGGTVTYSDVTDLTLNAGSGSNVMKVTGTPIATGTKTLNGGTGNDLLDLSALASSKVVLSAANATNGFDGTITGIANFTAVEEFKGSTAGTADEFVGLNAVATWTINDLTGSTYQTTKTAKFADFELLTGGSAKDTFKVQDNSKSNPLTLTGNGAGDSFLIGDTVNKLAGLKNLAVVGGADVGDELILNDQAEVGANDYTISATVAKVNGGVEVTHSTTEKITLNASQGKNEVTVIDGTYNPSTTIKLVDTTGNSTLLVDDTADTNANTWTISSTQTIRSVPTPTLTIDYSSLATLQSLTMHNGKGNDTVTIASTPATTLIDAKQGFDIIHVNKTSHATSVIGGDEDDTINVGNGDLDSIGAALTVDGGGQGSATRTVFSGGTESVDSKKFNPTSAIKLRGDTLNVLDGSQTGLQTYQVTNSKVSRTSAAQPVTYSNIEQLKLAAGVNDTDVVITVPLAADPQLPSVVGVDGGGASADNRVRIIGNVENNNITIGNMTAVETNRSQFEVASVRRLWVEAGRGQDVIHNRSTVPGLLDGDQAKTDAQYSLVAGAEDDIISSEAPSTSTLSPVLLGNDGKDFLHTTNASSAGTTFLVGDYFINNMVKFTATTPLPTTSRIQVVAANSTLPALSPAEAGDRYATSHAGLSTRNQVLARLDTLVQGRFNLVGAENASSLDVIGWLQAKLPLAITPLAVVKMIPPINRAVREFVRDPGAPANPAPSHVTYNPLGQPLPSGSIPAGSPLLNGGEDIPEDEVPPTVMTNPFERTDVNADGKITAFDALAIINELNRNGARPIDNSPSGEFGSETYSERPLQFYDVNGDMKITAMDALAVINKLNTRVTEYAMPERVGVSILAEIDLAESIDNQQFAEEMATLSPPSTNTLSDDAILALLAAQDDAEESE
jgi:hypothetical protein